MALFAKGILGMEVAFIQSPTGSTLALFAGTETGVECLRVWTVGVACRLQAIWTRAGKAFDQATPLYSTGISCLSMTWNSSTIRLANSPLYSSRWSSTEDTAACIASNVGCHLPNAFFFRNFHSRSIRFTF